MNTKYIVRIESGSTRGWNVRVPINFEIDSEKYHCKFFPFKRHGGIAKAKIAAIQYRDDYLIKSGQDYLIKNDMRSAPRRISDSKNTSGILGVRRVIDYKDAGDGYYYEYASWMAQTSIDRKLIRRQFSVGRYGEKEAFRMACQYRYKHGGDLKLTGNMSDFPCRIPVPYKKVKPRKKH